MASLLIAAASSRGGGALVAQTAVPEIPFDANADLLKTPADVYVGEVAGVGANSKGQIFVYTRTGHPYATLGDNRTFCAAARGCSSSIPPASSCASSGRTSTASTPRSGCASIRRTTSGRSTPRRARS